MIGWKELRREQYSVLTQRVQTLQTNEKNVFFVDNALIASVIDRHWMTHSYPNNNAYKYTFTHSWRYLSFLPINWPQEDDTV